MKNLKDKGIALIPIYIHPNMTPFTIKSDIIKHTGPWQMTKDNSIITYMAIHVGDDVKLTSSLTTLRDAVKTIIDSNKENYPPEIRTILEKNNFTLPFANNESCTEWIRCDDNCGFYKASDKTKQPMATLPKRGLNKLLIEVKNVVINMKTGLVGLSVKVKQAVYDEDPNEYTGLLIDIDDMPSVMATKSKRGRKPKIPTSYEAAPQLNGIEEEEDEPLFPPED